MKALLTIVRSAGNIFCDLIDARVKIYDLRMFRLIKKQTYCHHSVGVIPAYDLVGTAPCLMGRFVFIQAERTNTCFFGRQ